MPKTGIKVRKGQSRSGKSKAARAINWLKRNAKGPATKVIQQTAK